MLYLMLILIVVQLFLFIRKSRHDFDIHLIAYENQKTIIRNQHSIADALILIMKLTSGSTNQIKREEMIAKREEMIAKLQLPKTEDLPN